MITPTGNKLGNVTDAGLDGQSAAQAGQGWAVAPADSPARTTGGPTGLVRPPGLTRNRPRMALGRRDHHRAHPTDGPTSPLTTNPTPTTNRTRSTGHPKQGRGTPLPTDDHPPSKLTRGRQRSPYDRHEISRLVCKSPSDLNPRSWVKHESPPSVVDQKRSVVDLPVRDLVWANHVVLDAPDVHGGPRGDQILDQAAGASG